MHSASKEETRRVMGTLAHADANEIERLMGLFLPMPEWRYLREPEIGLVMVQGKISGSGAPFNLGEVTVTRAAVGLSGGTTGHAYLMGRDKNKATNAAILHAMWQSKKYRDRIEADVIAPLERLETKRQSDLSQETAPTKVDFYTLVRGDG